MECLRCGECCTRYQAYVTLQESRRIAREMGETWPVWLAKYSDPRWPGVESFLLIHQKRACIFLRRDEGGKTTRCLIHTVKPAACKSWLPGWEKRECREGLSRNWGLTVKSNGKLQGVTENIRDFVDFVATLS